VEAVPARARFCRARSGADPARWATAGPWRTTAGLNEPRIEGVKLDDRYAVVYSPYAVGAGLDGIATFHSRGYAPADAGGWR